MKKKLVALTERLHRLIFRSEMGLEMRSFLGNLSWSFFGGLASIVTFAINILAGRLMGPEEYGKYSLVLVIMDYFLILFFAGIDIASVRAVAKSKNEVEVSKNISSSAYFVFSTMAVVSLLALLASSPLARIFSTSPKIVHFAIILALFSGLRLLLNGYIQGIHQFKQQFFGRLTEILLTTLTFLILFGWLKRYDFGSYVLTISAGAIATSIIYFPKLKKFFGHFDKTTLKEQFTYSRLFLLSSILGTVFLSIDKLIINRYVSLAQLGLYMAYYTVAVNLITQLSQIFNNVFMPTVAKNLNKSIYRKLDRITRLMALPILFGIMIAVYITLLLFGKQYSLVWYLVLGFSLIGFLRLLLSTYNSIIVTFPSLIYKKYLVRYNTINALTAILYIPVIALNLISLKIVLTIQIANLVMLVLMQRRLIKESV